MADEHPEAPFARPLGPMAAAGWSAAFLLVFAFGLAFVIGVRPGSEHDHVMVALIYTAAALLVLWFVSRVHAPEAELRHVLGARPIGVLSALIAAAMGACASFPLRFAEELVTRRFISAEDTAAVTEALASIGQRQRIAGTAALLLIAPIADELFFRGALITGIARDRGRASAAIATALMFALVSASGYFYYLPIYIAMGLLFAHARLATGSVLAAIGAHLAYGGAALAHSFRVYGTIDPLVSDTSARLSNQVLVGTALATVALAWLLARVGAGEPIAATEAKSEER
jgi:membrane protease YdiL (CAAX protease family)